MMSLPRESLYRGIEKCFKSDYCSHCDHIDFRVIYKNANIKYNNSIRVFDFTVNIPFRVRQLFKTRVI